MTWLTNIQQILSNIPSVEKVQQVQQHQAQIEQSRLESQKQKASEMSGEKIDDAEPSDRVEISVKGDRQGGKREHEKRDREEERDKSDGERRHIDIKA